MTYRNIANVNIALQNARLTAIGFGTPLFISSHAYFPERVRTYSSLLDASVDLPTTSKAYKALQGGFATVPRPAFIKVGRRDADLTLTLANGATTASVSVSVLSDGDIFTVVADVTGSTDLLTTTALQNAIEDNTDIAGLITITKNDRVLNITATGGAKLSIKNLSDTLTDSYTTSETPSDVLNEIAAEDDDFYFVTADDHTETFVLAMADAVEAMEKIYFVSTYEQASLTAYVDGSSTDILGKLRNKGLFRTKGMFHQEANVSFPELKYVCINAGFLAGTVSWSNLVLSLSASTSPNTGLNLSSTQKGNLEDRNSAYVENLGSSVLRNGRVASGESIDVIRGRDDLTYTMRQAYVRLLISQSGSKLNYNDPGIVALEATCVGVLDRFVNRGFINPNYIVNFPRVDDVSASDKSNRIYTMGTWQAELTGAIEIVDPIQGILSVDL